MKLVFKQKGKYRNPFVNGHPETGVPVVVTEEDVNDKKVFDIVELSTVEYYLESGVAAVAPPDKKKGKTKTKVKVEASAVEEKDDGEV